MSESLASAKLSTTFTPSRSCLTDHYGVTVLTTGGWFIDFHLGPPTPTGDCLPPGWAPQNQYFSPGVCPSGYTLTCWSIVSGETAGTCCPSGYECQGTSDGGVIFPWVLTEPCGKAMEKFTPNVVLVTKQPTDGGPAVLEPMTLVSDLGRFNAYGVSIRFREKDIPTTTDSTPSETSGTDTRSTLSVASPTGGSSGESLSTGGAATTNTSTPTSTSSHGLSTGAKAGIGIGVGIAGLLFLAVIVFFLLRRRRPPAPELPTWKPELAGDAQSPISSPIVETPANEAFRRQELQAENRARFELPSQTGVGEARELES